MKKITTTLASLFSSGILGLAWKSLLNRKATALLTIFTIAISVVMVLGVEKIRSQARESFSNTVSGTDLIVGARSGSIQLLLYSVFHIGSATNNISWKSYQKIAHSKKVKWIIPISLGDSHRGFRVLGTNLDYFKYFCYGHKQPLKLAQGKHWNDLFGAVIGAQVARDLGYKIGQKIVISHGIGSAGLVKHDTMPFYISGILKPTGTPVDQTVHVSLKAIEAVHVDWKFGAQMPGVHTSAKKVKAMDLQTEQVTAALVGLKSRLSVFSMQRAINKFKAEPLLAVMPGVTLFELWDMMGTAETALMVISWFVVVAGILGLLGMLLSSLNERRREMAILRSVGGRPSHIVSLLTVEAGLLTFLGIMTGVILFYLFLFIMRPFILDQFGIEITMSFLSARELMILSVVLAVGFLIGLIPAYQSYRYSLSDGMMVKT